MPRGKNTIRPEDNPKPFKQGNKAAEKWTEENALQLGDELIEWLTDKSKPQNVFFEEFLIIEKDLNTKIISYLSNKFSTFSNLLEKAKKVQELKLLKLGLDNKLNPTLTKFVLTNHHDYKERKEESLTGQINVNQITGMVIT